MVSANKKKTKHSTSKSTAAAPVVTSKVDEDGVPLEVGAVLSPDDFPPLGTAPVAKAAAGSAPGVYGSTPAIPHASAMEGVQKSPTESSLNAAATAFELSDTKMPAAPSVQSVQNSSVDGDHPAQSDMDISCDQLSVTGTDGVQARIQAIERGHKNTPSPETPQDDSSLAPSEHPQQEGDELLVDDDDDCSVIDPSAPIVYEPSVPLSEGSYIFECNPDHPMVAFRAMQLLLDSMESQDDFSCLLPLKRTYSRKVLYDMAEVQEMLDRDASTDEERMSLVQKLLEVYVDGLDGDKNTVATFAVRQSVCGPTLVTSYPPIKALIDSGALQVHFQKSTIDLVRRCTAGYILGFPVALSKGALPKVDLETLQKFIYYLDENEMECTLLKGSGFPLFSLERYDWKENKNGKSISTTVYAVQCNQFEERAVTALLSTAISNIGDCWQLWSPSKPMFLSQTQFQSKLDSQDRGMLLASQRQLNTHYTRVLVPSLKSIRYQMDPPSKTSKVTVRDWLLSKAATQYEIRVEGPRGDKLFQQVWSLGPPVIVTFYSVRQSEARAVLSTVAEELAMQLKAPHKDWPRYFVNPEAMLKKRGSLTLDKLGLQKWRRSIPQLLVPTAMGSSPKKSKAFHSQLGKRHSFSMSELEECLNSSAQETAGTPKHVRKLPRSPARRQARPTSALKAPPTQPSSGASPNRYDVPPKVAFSVPISSPPMTELRTASHQTASSLTGNEGIAEIQHAVAKVTAEREMMAKEIDALKRQLKQSSKPVGNMKLSAKHTAAKSKLYKRSQSPNPGSAQTTTASDVVPGAVEVSLPGSSQTTTVSDAVQLEVDATGLSGGSSSEPATTDTVPAAPETQLRRSDRLAGNDADAPSATANDWTQVVKNQKKRRPDEQLTSVTAASAERDPMAVEMDAIMNSSAQSRKQNDQNGSSDSAQGAAARLGQET